MAVPDGDGDSVLGIHAQRPVLGVVGQGAAGGPQQVEEFGGLGGTGDLAGGRGACSWLASRMASAARCGVIWSSRR